MKIKKTCDNCSGTACHSCAVRTHSLWTPKAYESYLPTTTIRNNIRFLELIAKEAFGDDHPALKQMVKDMKKELKLRKKP
jgi:hypothetical protein